MELSALNKKRRDYFERHLLNSLDVLAFLELIVIYLHDISFLRLLVGSALQSLFLSPKSHSAILAIGPGKRYILSLLVGYNTLCILLHALTSLPSPKSGKYLHGSFTIEFIGVEALNSRIPLVCWSIALLLVQLVSFALRFPVKSSDSQETEDENGTRVATLDSALSGHLNIANIQVYRSMEAAWAEPFGNSFRPRSNDISETPESQAAESA